MSTLGRIKESSNDDLVDDLMLDNQKGICDVYNLF
jgi:hypothetical protein